MLLPSVGWRHTPRASPWLLLFRPCYHRSGLDACVHACCPCRSSQPAVHMQLSGCINGPAVAWDTGPPQAGWLAPCLLACLPSLSASLPAWKHGCACSNAPSLPGLLAALPQGSCSRWSAPCQASPALCVRLQIHMHIRRFTLPRFRCHGRTKGGLFEHACPGAAWTACMHAGCVVAPPTHVWHARQLS